MAPTAAEESRRAKNEAYAGLEAFAYSVSDDLRSPLATIRIFAEFTLKDYVDVFDERTQEGLRHIIRSLDRGIGGPILSASSYLMKSPPVQRPDDEGRASVEAFIRGDVDADLSVPLVC